MRLTPHRERFPKLRLTFIREEINTNTAAIAVTTLMVTQARADENKQEREHIGSGFGIV